MLGAWKTYFMVKMWCLEKRYAIFIFVVIFGSSRSASASSSFVERIVRKWECCMFVRSRAQIAVIAVLRHLQFKLLLHRQDPLLLCNPPQPPRIQQDGAFVADAVATAALPTANGKSTRARGRQSAHWPPRFGT